MGARRGRLCEAYGWLSGGCVEEVNAQAGRETIGYQCAVPYQIPDAAQAS